MPEIIIEVLTEKDPRWEQAADYAERCSWSAGKALARAMRHQGLNGWERVFTALDGSRMAGFCTLSETDCLSDVPYTPYISYVFVGEPYRGKRLSQRLISSALDYAGELGFQKVYLVSDHVGLYEKYGFVGVDRKPAPWNPQVMETIFVHSV